MNAVATQSVKVFQTAAQRRKNGSLILSVGEANIPNIRAKRGGVNLERMAEPYVALPAHFQTDQGSVTLDREYDAVVFVPARQEANSTEYDEALFLDGIQKVIDVNDLAGAPVVLVMTDPGTFEGAEEDIRMERRAAVEEILEEYGLSVEWRFSPADMRLAEVDVTDAVEGFEMKPNGLFVHTSRGFEAGGETRQAVQRRAAELILDAEQPEEIYLPLAVGVNLHLIEVAAERGIPVHASRMSETAEWSPQNQERVARMLENPLITIHGKDEYQRGRIPAVVRRLSTRARLSNVKQIVITDPAGSEANFVRGAKNYWKEFKQLLGVNEDEPAQVTARTSVPTWTPAAAGAVPTGNAPAEDDLPF